MKKIVIVFLVITMALCLLTACSKSDSPNPDVGASPDYDNGGQNQEATPTEPLVPNRKIVYEASVSLTTTDVGATVATIRQSVLPNGWFDQEEINQNNSAYLVARIKTQKLDEFLVSLSSVGDVSSLKKLGTDVSLNYANNENKIATLQAERDRLVVLYNRANSINEMLPLIQRISTIEREIQLLEGILSNYDSLVEFSTVKINISQYPTKTTKPFKEQINNVFKGAWKVLVACLKGILMALTAVFPFAVVFVPVGIGAFFIVKIVKKKKVELIAKSKAKKSSKEIKEPNKKEPSKEEAKNTETKDN